MTGHGRDTIARFIPQQIRLTDYSAGLQVVATNCYEFARWPGRPLRTFCSSRASLEWLRLEDPARDDPPGSGEL